MAQDIFNRTIGGTGGAFSADDAVLTFNGATGLAANTPLLVQNLSVQYQQPVSMLFDMSSNKTFFVRGRATGSGSIAQIYGPARLQTTFLATYGNVCNVDKNLIQLAIKSGCQASGNLSALENMTNIVLNHVVLNSIGFSGSSQDMLFSQQVGMIFSALSPGAQNVAISV